MQNNNIEVQNASEDTEEFIKKVTSRFEEAKKMMNESNMYKPKH